MTVQWSLFGWTEPKGEEEPATIESTPAGGEEDEDSSRLVLQAVASGGARFERLVITRNRRVMASVAGGGRVLRLNEAFLDAPREILKAVGVLFSSRDGGRRARARSKIGTYLSTAVPPPAPRRPAVRNTTPRRSDLPLIDELRSEFRRVNREHFDSTLPEVPIRLSGRMRRRNGHFSVSPLEIAISRSLCTHAAQGEALHTLRHEMIHLWQWWSGSPLGHGPEFRRLARELDVHPRATRSVCWNTDRD